MYYVVDPAQFASLYVLMSNTLSIACTTLVLYGLYIVLFILAIRAITRRNPPRRRTLLAVTSVMFFLGTCDAVSTVALIGITMRVLNVLRLTEIIRTTLNIVVTDLLFLYRCYIIWDSRKKVLILPALCILATVVLLVTVCLQLYEGTYLIDPRAPFIMLLGTNLLLMFLTAGRIWYRGRGMHTILGPNFGKTYNSALALILESGAIYCFCAILLVASQTTQTEGEFGAIFYGISTGLATQTVNIAPTLILVRLGMDQDRIQQTTPVSDQLPSGGAIRFRAPVNLEDGSYPVVDFK
ncbi:MYND-type domain-containing protein [Mycena venus]|uniref:MYND-type domain-containing protein n=1 Tax=Mycena venus TaxID=2733690 RepID=A0A8H6XR46_9AGAR|nr:MYND-type domain-containing protein [Mycena venus]